MAYREGWVEDDERVGIDGCGGGEGGGCEKEGDGRRIHSRDGVLRALSRRDAPKNSH